MERVLRDFKPGELEELDRRFQKFMEENPELSREDLWRVIRCIHETHSHLTGEPTTHIVDDVLEELKKEITEKERERSPP